MVIRKYKKGKNEIYMTERTRQQAKKKEYRIKIAITMEIISKNSVCLFIILISVAYWPWEKYNLYNYPT